MALLDYLDDLRTGLFGSSTPDPSGAPPTDTGLLGLPQRLIGQGVNAAWQSLPPEVRQSWASAPEGLAALYRNVSTPGAIQDTTEALQDTARSAIEGHGWDTATNAVKALGAAVGVVPGGKLVVKGAEKLTEEAAKLIKSGLLEGGSVAGEKAAERMATFERAAPRGGFISTLTDPVYARSVNDMTADVRPTPGVTMLPKKEITPEDLQGGRGFYLMGDLTRGPGETLHAINDVPLNFPVQLHGGLNFLRGPQAERYNSFWANAGPSATVLRDAMSRELDKGKPLYGVYSGMGAQSGDASHMMADAIMAQDPAANVSKGNVRQFDSAMRQKNKDWPGLADVDAARAHLATTTGGERAAFAKLMAQEKQQAQGFPDIASTRFAISHPELVKDAPARPTGAAVASIVNPGIITHGLLADLQHGTYPAQITAGTGGGYVGGLLHSVPRADFFSTAQGALERRPPPFDVRTQADRTFMTQLPVQNFDQQWVDRMMKKYYDR